MVVEASVAHPSVAQSHSRDSTATPSYDAESTAFFRARDLLRQERPLAIEQFEEIDALFRRVTRAEFDILTRDLRHQRQLRSYEALSWRQGFPILLVMIALLAAIFVAGGIFVFAR